MPSSAKPWRLLIHGPAPGPWNMAVDQYFLESAPLDGVGGVVRFYGWIRPTLSFGYLQRFKRTVDRAFCEAHGIDVVRRPTGGRAVLHHQEITYSVVTSSADFPGGASVTESYRVISEGLCRGLNLAGVAAEVSRPSLPERAGPARGDEGPRSSSPCFASISRYELTWDGRKLLGSSQRRLGGCFLQHGSLPVVPHWDLLLGATGQAEAALEGDNPFVSLGEAAGLGEGDIEGLVHRLAEGMAGRLGVELVEEPLSGDEQRGVEQLARERFATDQWNFDR